LCCKANSKKCSFRFLAIGKRKQELPKENEDTKNEIKNKKVLESRERTWTEKKLSGTSKVHNEAQSPSFLGSIPQQQRNLWFFHPPLHNESTRRPLGLATA